LINSTADEVEISSKQAPQTDKVLTISDWEVFGEIQKQD